MCKIVKGIIWNHRSIALSDKIIKSGAVLFFVLKHFANKSARLCYILGQKNAFLMLLLLKNAKNWLLGKCLPQFALIIILIYPFIRWIPVKIIFFCGFYDLCKAKTYLKNVLSYENCFYYVKIAFIVWKFYLKVNAITKNLGDALFRSSVWMFAQRN